MIATRKSTKRWALLAIALIGIAILAFAYAFTVSWSSTVTVTTTNPNIRVYWDSACTNPVTSLDFSNVQQGGFKEFSLWIRNEGGGEVKIYWNSTLGTVTTKIHDWWGFGSGRVNFGFDAWNGTTIGSGGVTHEYYQILVDGDAPQTTYTWTLNVGSWTD